MFICVHDMYVNICVYILCMYAYVRMYVCMHVHAHRKSRFHLSIHTYINIHIHIHIYTFERMQVGACESGNRASTTAYMHKYAYTYLHTYTHIQLKECKWVRVNQEIALPPQHTYQTDIQFMKQLRDEVHCTCMYACIYVCMYVCYVLAWRMCLCVCVCVFM